MTYGQMINGYRELFARIYTWDALGDRWLSNMEQWRTRSGRKRIQKPHGRLRPFMVLQVVMILGWYHARLSRAKFFWRILWGAATRVPRAITTSFRHFGDFIHFREYADKVIAKEWAFNYLLDDVNMTENTFGEGGGSTRVEPENVRKRRAVVSGGFDSAEVTRGATGRS